MKKIIFLLIIAFSLVKAHAQFVHVIEADSVLITNDSSRAELNLENSTKHVKGFLYNKGNGRTEFRKFVKLNDTTFIMGGDTLIIGGSGASRNFANSNLIFYADHTHNGNYKNIYLDNFGYTELRINANDGSVRGKMYLDSFGYFGTNSKYFYHVIDEEGWGGISATTADNETADFYLDGNQIGFSVHNNTNSAQSSVSYLTSTIDQEVAGPYVFDSTQVCKFIQHDDSLQFYIKLVTNDGPGGTFDYRKNEHLRRKDSTNNYIFQYHKTTGSLLKRTDFNQGLSSFTFSSSGALNPNLLFYLKSLPTSNDTSFQKLLIADDNGKVYKAGSWPSVPLSLQQVTTFGNVTTNTIKPYPNALPVGTNSDSVVVWSASDSLLKKIAPLQTFAQSATVAVSNTTAETTLIGSGAGSLVIPSATWEVGKSFEVTVQGIYSTDNTNPASITLKLKLGSTVIASSGAISMNANRTNIPFILQATITCISTGSSGSIYTFGDLFRDGKINAVNNGSSTSTINTTTSQTLNATVQLSDSSSGNSLSAFIVTLDPVN